MQAVGLANKGTGRRSKREERKEGSSAFFFPSDSGLHFLVMAEFLQDCSSCQLAPPLWLQLCSWTTGMNAISSLCFFWPSSDNSFPLLLLSGWQEPHITLNSVYSSRNNPFIKVFWTIYCWILFHARPKNSNHKLIKPAISLLCLQAVITMVTRLPKQFLHTEHCMQALKSSPAGMTPFKLVSVGVGWGEGHLEFSRQGLLHFKSKMFTRRCHFLLPLPGFPLAHSSESKSGLYFHPEYQ